MGSQLTLIPTFQHVYIYKCPCQWISCHWRGHWSRCWNIGINVDCDVLKSVPATACMLLKYHDYIANSTPVLCPENIATHYALVEVTEGAKVIGVHQRQLRAYIRIHCTTRMRICMAHCIDVTKYVAGRAAQPIKVGDIHGLWLWEWPDSRTLTTVQTSSEITGTQDWVTDVTSVLLHTVS